MVAEEQTRLQIGHVLFIDIVGYSKSLVNQQSELLRELNGVVSGTSQFCESEAQQKLIRLPTGDGMALVFRDSPEAPAQCALEIARALKEHRRIALRMGMHSGPVNEVTDVNQRQNIAGAGINMAQRVMDCGDAGHILVSKHVTEDLEQHDRWRPLLHELGPCEVKHGVRIDIANLYSDEVGNPQLPKKFQALKRHRSHVRWAEAAMALLVVAALAAGVVYFLRKGPARSLATAVEKSIAVLPFENLSEEKANAFFTEGVQDEILTHLARIADLKVISRTSVMQYKSGAPRNQREIAKAIADQLQAKLSPNEKKAIEQPPTTDLAAFDLYSRAKSLLLTANFSATQDPDLRKAIELLDEAVKRDSSFFDAYRQLAYAHETIYAVTGVDHTPARLALAEAAVQAATRLRPDAAETYLARAQYLYYGLRDYGGALAELEIARRALPNDPRLFELTGYILRRRGQQEEGLRNLQRAVELDPRNLFTLQQIALSYQYLGRYAEAIPALDRALAIVPDNVETRVARELFYLCWKGDTRPLRQTIDALLAQGPGAIANAADSWFWCALAERDPAAAERALVALGDTPCWNESTINLSRSFGEGLLARMTKDEARARTAFEAARAQQEKIVQAQPDYGPPLCVLGLIDAALGRKDMALDEGRRAIVLMPVEKDVTNGSLVLQYFAITAAWAGDKELALQQLEAGLRAPVASLMLSYGALKLFPVWDPLRGDPRFEKIVTSLAPKERH